MRNLQIVSVLTLLLLPFCLVGQTYIAVNVNQPPALIADAGIDKSICPGDSAFLGGNPTAGGGTAAFTYTWFPTMGLSSSTGSNPTASPSGTTSYILTITDSRNCTSSDTMTVLLDTCVGIVDWKLPITTKIYPNPAHYSFLIDLEGSTDGSDVRLNLIDVNGKNLHKRNLGPVQGRLTETIGIEGLARGVYFVKLEIGRHELIRRLVIQ